MRVISGTAAPALPHSLLPHLYPEHPGRHTPGLPGLCRQLLPDAGKYPHCLPQSCRCRLGRDPGGTRKGLLAENTPGARGLLRPCKPSAHAPSGRASASLPSPHAESRLPWPAPHAFAHALAKAAPLPAPQTPAPSWVSSSLLVPEWSLTCPPGAHLFTWGSLRGAACSAQSRAEAPGVTCSYLNRACGGGGTGPALPPRSSGARPGARGRVPPRLAL